VSDDNRLLGEQPLTFLPGNAKIEGMNDDLGLTGIQYNIALSIFFIPYILLEVPSNVLLKKFKRPSTYIGILVVSWGIIMTCTGVVNDFTGLMVCRVFLGVSMLRLFVPVYC
jgi:MFS family permease